MYDAVYFRPFNFKHEDTLRRKWSVQYLSMPDYDYDRLRKESPLVYENAVTPVPNSDDWFHANIVVTKDSIIVYVNYSATASLKVELLNNRSNGKIGCGLQDLAEILLILHLVNNPDRNVNEKPVLSILFIDYIFRKRSVILITK